MTVGALILLLTTILVPPMVLFGLAVVNGALNAEWKIRAWHAGAFLWIIAMLVVIITETAMFWEVAI